MYFDMMVVWNENIVVHIELLVHTNTKTKTKPNKQTNKQTNRPNIR
jgi:hypothetical protein